MVSPVAGSVRGVVPGGAGGAACVASDAFDVVLGGVVGEAVGPAQSGTSGAHFDASLRIRRFQPSNAQQAIESADRGAVSAPDFVGSAATGVVGVSAVPVPGVSAVRVPVSMVPGVSAVLVSMVAGVPAVPGVPGVFPANVDSAGGVVGGGVAAVQSGTSGAHFDASLPIRWLARPVSQQAIESGDSGLGAAPDLVGSAVTGVPDVSAVPVAVVPGVSAVPVVPGVSSANVDSVGGVVGGGVTAAQSGNSGAHFDASLQNRRFQPSNAQQAIESGDSGPGSAPDFVGSDATGVLGVSAVPGAVVPGVSAVPVAVVPDVSAVPGAVVPGVSAVPVVPGVSPDNVDSAGGAVGPAQWGTSGAHFDASLPIRWLARPVSQQAIESGDSGLGAAPDLVGSAVTGVPDVSAVPVAVVPGVSAVPVVPGVPSANVDSVGGVVGGGVAAARMGNSSAHFDASLQNRRFQPSNAQQAIESANADLGPAAAAPTPALQPAPQTNLAPALQPAPQTNLAPALQPAPQTNPIPQTNPAHAPNPIPQTNLTGTPAPGPQASQTHALTPQLAAPLFSLASAAPGQHVMTLRVSPEDLGPLTVRAHIDAAGVRIELFAPGDAGREAVRAALPELRRGLDDAGQGATLSLSSHNSPPNSDGGRGTGRDAEPQPRSFGDTPAPPSQPNELPGLQRERQTAVVHNPGSPNRLDILV